MNKLIVFSLIFIFIISTALTKNSTKKLDEKIYKKKENLAISQSRYNLLILEFDYLNSPEEIRKKMEQYFKNDKFSSIDILNLKILEIRNNKIKFNNFFNSN